MLKGTRVIELGVVGTVVATTKNGEQVFIDDADGLAIITDSATALPTPKELKADAAAELAAIRATTWARVKDSVVCLGYRIRSAWEQQSSVIDAIKTEKKAALDLYYGRS